MAAEEPRVRLTREWLEKAREDLDSLTRLSMTPPLTGLAVFHCQQAAEKALKGFLTWHDKPYRRSHELGDLVTECLEIDASFSTMTGAAKLLNPYAWQYRYPGRRQPSVEEMETAMDNARGVVTFVLEHLPPEVHP